MGALPCHKLLHQPGSGTLCRICCRYLNLPETDALSSFLLRELQGINFPLSPGLLYPTMSQPAQMALTKFHTCVWLKQQTFICHCSESWKFQDQGVGWGPFSWSAHGHHLAVSSHTDGREKDMVSLPLLVQAQISSWGTSLRTLSKSNYLPKATSPNTITLEVKALTYGLWLAGEGNTKHLIHKTLPAHMSNAIHHFTVLALKAMWIDLLISIFITIVLTQGFVTLMIIKSSLVSSPVMFHEYMFPRIKPL